MPAVSNSSPLILLAKIGQLALLRDLFDLLLIPPAVYDEVVTKGGGRAGSQEIGVAPWIQMRPVHNFALVQALQLELDEGEAAAIALAAALGPGADILLDDLDARRVAREHGLRVIGSAGVLVAAKDHSLVPAVRPLLDDLRAAGLYLGRAAYELALREAGELP